MKPGGVDQRHDRQPPALAQLEEVGAPWRRRRRSALRPGESTGWPGPRRGCPSTRASAVTSSGAHAARSQVTLSWSASASTTGRTSKASRSFSGSIVAQRRLVVAGRRTIGRSAQVAEHPPHDGDGLRLVLDDHVEHAVGRLLLDRPDLLGGELAQPASGDHRRAGHAQVGVGRRDPEVGAPGDARRCRRSNGRRRRRSAGRRSSAPHSANEPTSSAETSGKSVSPGRPPPPSVKNTTGQAHPARRSR